MRGFFDDAWHAVKTVVSDTADVAVTVFEDTPVAPELFDALKDFIRGPLRDFAKTPYGMVVFRAMSTTIYGPWAYTLGPQLASFVFALPGLARGQNFFEAWFDEVRWRTEKTAEVLGAEAATSVVPNLKETVDKIKNELLAQIPEEELRKMTLDTVAKMLGVNDVKAALALEWVANELDWDWNPFPGRDAFDDYGNLRSIAVDSYRFTPEMLLRNDRVQAYRFTTDMVASSLEAGQQSADRAAAPVYATPPSRNKTIGDVVLIGVIGVAAAAVVWFYAWEKKRT